MVIKLTDLPVELLTKVYLAALCPSFPHTCKYIYTVVKSLPPSVNAYYIFGRHPPGIYFPYSRDEPTYIIGPYLTHALRYPICTIPVLEAMIRIVSKTSIWHVDVIDWDVFELPKRLFRSLGDSGTVLGPDSDPLPLLRFLWDTRTDIDLVKPMPNSHNGYPLVRAVHARFILLIRFLLDRGADPSQRGYMAVKVAIGKKDLALVRMLVEFEPEARSGAGAAKKRRRADRIFVKPFMLDLAVRCDARDIVQYFMQEKGCVPHMKTLKAI